MATMIQGFGDDGTRDIWNGENTKDARRTLPTELWKVAQRRLSYLHHAATLEDLAKSPGAGLEKLKGDRDGQYSVRVNDQYRVCFWWTDAGPADVEIVDYH